MRHTLQSAALSLCILSSMTFAGTAKPTTPVFDARVDAPSPPSSQNELPQEEELRLVRAALDDAYPRLPPDLQAIARKVVFLVSNGDPVWSVLVFGWGPEDDPEYRYPDTKFYPKGTIKVTLTKKTVTALALGEKLAPADPNVAEGVRVFGRYVIAHELTHARQCQCGARE